MQNYIIARLLGTIPSLLIVVFFVVVLVRLLPGNAAEVMLQDNPRGGDTSRQELEERLGIADSLPEAYAKYIGKLLQGSLGESIWTGSEIRDLVQARMSVTIKLLVAALIFAVATGIPIGLISAIMARTWVDLTLRSISIVGLSVPNFAVATMVVVLPLYWWGWSPSLIYKPPSEGLAHYTQFLLPAAILALPLSATLMRLTRTSVMEVLALDYVRTARAKGLQGRVIVVRHVLRNSLIPVLSLIGVQLSYLFSGALIIETVFSIPGIGRTMIETVGTRDYPAVQGLTLVSGFFVIITNLVVDLSYGIVDPRLRKA